MPETLCTLKGRVIEITDNGYFKVFCPDAPVHLRHLFLEQWAIRSAKLGNRVTLAYRSSGTRGNWVVTEVHS